MKIPAFVDFTAMKFGIFERAIDSAIKTLIVNGVSKKTVTDDMAYQDTFLDALNVSASACVRRSLFEAERRGQEWTEQNEDLARLLITLDASEAGTQAAVAVLRQDGK